MNRMLRKTAFREIKGTFGRFFAIFAIIALGVGFFSGVRITTPAMVNTINKFLDDHGFFDYRLVCNVGWDEKSVEEAQAQPKVRAAEGCYSTDLLISDEKQNEYVFKAHSITEKVNTIELVAGRMPENRHECVVDDKFNGFPLGSTITVSKANDDTTTDMLREESYTVVGRANSSYYINFERGTTSIGNGTVTGFIYLLPGNFHSDVYTDIFVRFDQDYKIYSKEYKDYMKERKKEWEPFIKEMGEERFIRFPLLSRMLGNIDEPETYLLGRNTNIGYACFESDSQIVAQVAKVFPVFFILVAALVCMTTMSRMVEEQRGQIGVLKALGYSEAQVMGKFLFYSGSAALLGCIIGYGVGTVLFPRVIWVNYQLMYFGLPIRYVFSVQLAIISLVVALACSMGITYVSCHMELSETAAGLMRPRAPKAGKRVFLEYITPVWKRLKFMHKVSVRNIFRYKRRLFMMVLGISGCTALLMTGLGLNDSVAGFAEAQYDEIETADCVLTYAKGKGEKLPEELSAAIKQNSEEYMPMYEGAWDLETEDKVKSITLRVPEDISALEPFFSLKDETKTPITDIKKGEAAISHSISERYGLSVGDEFLLRNEDLDEIRLRVSAVFENHVYNYVFISPETMKEQVKGGVNYNAVFINFPQGADTYRTSAVLMKTKNVTNVNLLQDLKTRLSKMMNSLNYVVFVVIMCAAGLAFIVLYNLTNINITERLREIATIKVLGFYQRESAQYVFRENLVLTSLGIAVGLILGIFLHRYVMAQIVVDLVDFRVHISGISFLLSIVLTYVFNFMVNLVMNRKIDRINMAESLKSVE